MLVMALYALGRHAESDVLLASFEQKYVASVNQASDLA
jgi:hypothetical protein